jgi:uncharacterized membrane protein YhaH (DUF805 family)
MFKSPFTYKGRITRTEFGLTHLISYILVIIVLMAILFPHSWTATVFLLILLFVVIWFRIAQGAKRCHDIGISGLYQFIPFYTVVLLFQKGKVDTNEYGVSPKIAVVDEVCKVLLIKSDSIIIELNNGKKQVLENITLPKYAKKGDLIKHDGNGYYIVVDSAGNLIFRM